jgi:DNA-binding PadR family transcriptional regulator
MDDAQRIETQNLARHCNEDLILAILLRGERHGYQLALELEERSGGFFRFNHGTLYPILHKLEQDGMIRGTWKREGPKRRRKSYTLTEKGRDYAALQRGAWRDFFTRFFEIMEDGLR